MMEEITGLDISDIERMCRELREGHLDDDDFRHGVLSSLGYSKEVIDGEQELSEIAALWD
jgi:hypothetical protein